MVDQRNRLFAKFQGKVGEVLSELVVEKVGKGELVRLKGRLDAITSPPLEIKLLALIRTSIDSLLLDFDKVDYLSSAGVRMLLSLTKVLGNKKNLIIFNVHKDLLQILKMTGFDQVLHIVENEAEALKQIS